MRKRIDEKSGEISSTIYIIAKIQFADSLVYLVCEVIFCFIYGV